MRLFIPGLLMIALSSCITGRPLEIPRRSSDAPGGKEFFQLVLTVGREEREKQAVKEIINGNIPGFLKQLVPVTCSITDSSGNRITAEYYVTPDYLAVGKKRDWVRMPLTPQSAQLIAEAFECFLPTRKMVNDIWAQARVKLEPIPLVLDRDSASGFLEHNRLIEEQRRGRKGLIAGIKKDVVISGKLLAEPAGRRVAIYGWHRLNGEPIQPLYTGHAQTHVDYSHGIRLVYKNILVNGQWMDYEKVLSDPVLKTLLCDEDSCSFFRYEY